MHVRFLRDCSAAATLALVLLICGGCFWPLAPVWDFVIPSDYRGLIVLFWNAPVDDGTQGAGLRHLRSYVGGRGVFRSTKSLMVPTILQFYEVSGSDSRELIWHPEVTPWKAGFDGVRRIWTKGAVSGISGGRMKEEGERLHWLVAFAGERQWLCDHWDEIRARHVKVLSEALGPSFPDGIPATARALFRLNVRSPCEDPSESRVPASRAPSAGG